MGQRTASHARVTHRPVLLEIIEPSCEQVKGVMTTTRVPLLAEQRPGTRDLEQLSSADTFALTPQGLLNGYPRERAWAAYWIGRDQQEQEIPLLLDALEYYQGSAVARSSDWSDDDRALLVVLELRFNGMPMCRRIWLRPCNARFPVPTLIRLARSREDARRALLTIMDGTKSRTDWLAAADMLAANPPPGFAAKLLSDISNPRDDSSVESRSWRFGEWSGELLRWVIR
jgi:hypothetical protein